MRCGKRSGKSDEFMATEVGGDEMGRGQKIVKQRGGDELSGIHLTAEDREG